MNASATANEAAVFHVRSKNAGPFWLTVDVFCDDATVFARLCADARLGAPAIAKLMRADEGSIKTFHIAALNVIKISLPRPLVQGSLDDRDMHGAAWANLVRESLETAE